MPTTPRHPLNKRIPDRRRPAEISATPAEITAWMLRMARAADAYTEAMNRTVLTIAESLAPTARQISQAIAAAAKAGHRQAITAARDEYTLTR